MDLVQHFRRARNAIDHQAGIVLFNAGEPATSMFVIVEGSVSIVVSGKVIEIAGPGSLVGEMAMVDSSFRSATVITRTDCRIVPVDKTHFDSLVRESPEFARHVMTVMADRLRHMNELLAKEP
jgi:CRP/FNR family cyclic AMP-dependent transcriptional regulator